MKTVLIVAAVVVASCLLTTSQAQAVVVIDHFVDGTFTLTVTSAVPTATLTQTGLSCLGGQRDVKVEWLSGVGNNNVQGQVDINYLDYLSFSAQSQTQGRLTLDYGMGGDLNADLYEGGANDRISVVFVFSDLSGSVASLTLKSGVKTQTVTKMPPSGPSTIDFFFADFNTFTSSDFQDIDTIKFVLKGAVAGDYTIHDLESSLIPEPATMFGLCLGVGGLATYIRKRRAAK